MAEFNNMSLTNKGKLLYAKAQAGIELHFTKMQIGSGTIGAQNPETLLALIAPKYDIGIQSISPNTEAKTATISGMINNDSVTEATYICEIGLFAQDPDDGEILYAYGSAGNYGDYMAPPSSGAYSWNYQIIAAVGNAANVTVQLSNLSYDYGVINTGTTYTFIVGGNQKEINKSIDDLFKLYTTTNTGNIYSVTVPNFNFKDGYPLRIKFNTASTDSVSLKVNTNAAKPIKNYFGNAVTNIRQNLIANLAYESTSDSFILQGKGGGGNLTAADLLINKTATGDSGQIIGTMPENGTLTANLNCGQSFNVPNGHAVGGTITANSLASQTPGNADASKILNGFSAWVNGNKVDGNATSYQYATGSEPVAIVSNINEYRYLNLDGKINFAPDLVVTKLIGHMDNGWDEYASLANFNLDCFIKCVFQDYGGDGYAVVTSDITPNYNLTTSAIPLFHSSVSTLYYSNITVTWHAYKFN